MYLVCGLLVIVFEVTVLDLDFADSAVVAVVPPVSVESAGSLLQLAFVSLAASSTAEVVSLVMLSHHSFPVALYLYPEVDALSVTALLGAADHVEKFHHFLG